MNERSLVRFVVALIVFVVPRTIQARDGADTVAIAASNISEATVQIDSGHELSSGVVISSDGYVLTVAHGLADSAARVRIHFFDGTPAAADVVLRNRLQDVALLKIENRINHTLTALPFATDENVVNLSVIACGYPARSGANAPPILRIGKVLGGNAKSLRSSCVLTAGDSGGPLTTADGRLLGIHRRIGVGRTVNLHLKIDACRKALLDTIDIRQLKHAVSNSKTPSQVALASPLVVRSLKRRTVRIHNEKGAIVAWGTVMDANTIVTKLSLLKPSTRITIRTSAGLEFHAKTVNADRASDVAVLKLSAPMDFDNTDATSRHVPQVGEIVFGNGKGDPGIISRVELTEASARPRLGCTLSEVDGRLEIDQISPNSAAADAGLKPGNLSPQSDDRCWLLGISDQPTTRLAEVGTVLQKFQPGDWISFRIRQNGVEQFSHGQLRHQPSEMLARTEHLDGRAGALSLRRSAFFDVIQHDLPLSVQQMGGPIVSADGTVIGINIARRAREAVLAIPIEAVTKMMAQE